MEKHALAFCAEVGVQHLSPDMLADFTRNRILTPGSAPVVFAPATLKLIETVSERILDAYVEEAGKASTLLEGQLGEDGELRLALARAARQSVVKPVLEEKQSQGSSAAVVQRGQVSL